MAAIYQLNGQSVYDNSGKTYDAKTGQVVSGAVSTQTPSTPPVASPYANPNANYYSTPATPVASLSSAAGQQVVTNNTSTLQKIESAYSGPSVVDYLNSTGQKSDYGSRQQLATQAGIQDYSGTAGQNTQLLSILRNPTGSPALTSMVNDVNKAVSGGNLTTGQAQGLTALQQTQDAITKAAASARLALESGDYQAMNQYTKAAQDAQKAFTDQLAAYHEEIAPLRAKALELLSPTAREQELSKQLNDIRSQSQSFDLQTEQDKLAEYQGQTLGFAGSRAAQLDFKASFKRQEYALKEQNLLNSLGLEQEARKMQATAIDQQMGYIANDYELQTKITERLQQQEQDLLDKANTLQANSKSTLMSILTGLQGVDPSTMNPDSLKNLELLSTQAGIPFDLVLQALKTQHDRTVFEDSLKVSKDTGFTLSAGQSRYDANGKLITTAPENKTTVSTQPDKYNIDVANRTLSSVDNLITKAVANPEIFGRSAALPLPDFLRSDAFRNYESQLETLKSNVFTSQLQAMRDASKTGGAVGNVSDREGDRFANALGALRMDQSASEVQKQLVILKDSVNTWLRAVNQSNVQDSSNQQDLSSGKRVTAPDGSSVIISD